MTRDELLAWLREDAEVRAVIQEICAAARVTRRRAAPPKPPVAAQSAPVWDAYAGAYRARYGVEPIRNATVNGRLALLVKRVGAERAPALAAWYVAHNDPLY